MCEFSLTPDDFGRTGIAHRCDCDATSLVVGRAHPTLNWPDELRRTADYWMLTTNYFSNEPKPVPMHGLDVLRGLRRILQCLADLPQARRQRPLAHHRIRPYYMQELVFGHQPPGVLCQIAQHGKSFRRQFQSPLSTPHPLVLDIHPQGRTRRLAPRRHNSPQEIPKKSPSFLMTSHPPDRYPSGT